MTHPASEFVELFQDEAHERLDRVVETLVALESGRAPADALESVMRDVHTIKGAAGMVGFDDVRALAHAVEDVLAGLGADGYRPELTDVLLRSADTLRRQADGADESGAELIGELALAVRAAAGQAVPAAGTSTGRHTPAAGSDRRSIRVAPEKLDTLLDLVGETVLHRQRLEHVLDGREASASRETSDELDVGARLLGELKDTAVGMRTLPLASIVAPFPRAVRDLAAEHGKEVELDVIGAKTELDRAILEGLSEPLVHLLRNAIAHGIEPPDERERAGKPRCGRLTMRAEQRGGSVEVVVSDDGRGVSEQALAEARVSGSLADVLARAGFSTTSEVSDLSGRGAGFGAAKQQVEAFGGSVEARSEPGAGTQIVLRLPLALALLEVLLLERAGTVYGIPLASVEEVLAVGETLSLEGRPSIELRGRSVPLADLADLTRQPAPALAERSPAVVIVAAGARLAAACDALLGKEEVVVKSLGPLLEAIDSYLGAAILGDGRIAFLLDPASLAPAGTRPQRVSRSREAAPARDEPPGSTVLVVEDSFIVRELQRSILESAGYRVALAKDGVEAIERLDQDETIKLVVTDVDMPEMGGIELTEAIRANPSRASLPVVIVTSRGEDEERRRGLDAGADAYMVKRGFDQQALLETVERLVGT